MDPYIRAQMAKEFMVAMLRIADPDNVAPPAILANHAVLCADALIARLGVSKDGE